MKNNKKRVPLWLALKLNGDARACPLQIITWHEIVNDAVVIGAINAGNASAHYAVDKATRETDLVWASVRAGAMSTFYAKAVVALAATGFYETVNSAYHLKD